MKQVLLSSVLMVSVLALSACGTGSGTTTGGDVTGKPNTSKNPSIVDPLTDGPTVGAALKGGALLAAGQYNATRVTYDAKTNISAQTRPSASIQKNLRGGYDVTIAGKVTSFGYADLKPSGDAWEQLQKNPNGTGTVYSMTLWNAGKGGSKGVESEENGQTFHKILGYYAFDNTGTGTRERGHFVVGNATDPLKMGLKSKTATYNGYLYANIMPPTGLPMDQSMAVSSGIKMTADFDKDTISGQSTTFKIRDAGGSEFYDQNYTIWLKQAGINGNFFNGQMDSNFAYMNGTYTGQFYGGNAQEVAGVLNGKSGISITEGYFTAVAEPAK